MEKKVIYGKLGYHTGIDFVAENRKIYSATNGKVINILEKNITYGNVVIISYQEYYIWYCHLEKINVKKNQIVTPLTIIGIQGSTGNVTGEHLHFEIRDNTNLYTNNINPSTILNVPNKLGTYNSKDFLFNDENEKSIEVKKLKSRTHLREKPDKNSNDLGIYLPETSVEILEKVDKNWNKVRIRVTKKEGYMINNFK